MNPENLKLAVELRRALHAHPELSMEETWTKAALIDFLKTHTGLEICDRGRWFYAIYHGGTDAPAMAFRADFDAVPVEESNDIPWKSQFPGVAHKCGHDGHSAALAAFALEVWQRGAAQDVYFLFQHAEEIGGGAVECQAFIPEHNIAEIFAFHNMPGLPKDTACMRVGTTQCASRGMSVFFTGWPSHASRPEDGCNPAFAQARLVLTIPELLVLDDWQDMVLCTVVESSVGGPAFGVSPGEGVVRMTVRAAREAEMETLITRLERAAAELAEAEGLTVRFEYQDAFPETVAHASSVAKVQAACDKLGIPTLELSEGSRGSEDFGYYTKLIPGAMFMLGAGDVPPVHTHAFDFDDELIPLAVRIFGALAGVPLV